MSIFSYNPVTASDFGFSSCSMNGHKHISTHQHLSALLRNLGNAGNLIFARFGFFIHLFWVTSIWLVAFALLILLLFRLVPISPFPISTSLTHYLWMYRVRIAISSFALVKFYETIQVQTLNFKAHLNIEQIDEL